MHPVDHDAAPTHVPGVLRAAAGIVLAEALALVGAAVVVVIETAVATPHDVLRALFVAAGALLAAVVLAFAARGLLHLRPSARSPILVLQILALPVGWTMAFDAHRPGYGGPILLAALAVLYLLFTPPARDALDREPPG